MGFSGKIVFLLFAVITVHVAQAQKDMVKIKGGTYIPLYGVDSVAVTIDDFSIDVYPVTNAEYLAFVKAYPTWQKSKVIRLFADANYLRDWEDNLSYGKVLSDDAPVTNVSWFAAKNYCEYQGKRLPTIDEWEYVAMADEISADARSKKSYNQKILDWYEAPKSFNKPIGSTFKNYWGVYDMHGLVWEWTMDFNAVLISGESRKDVDKDSNLFCGSAAVGASDLMNYAAFMRYAFRGSMKANYAIKTLGFRCAKDAIE
ncbi:Formylglycine-generating enzyme, required for sulfatase activity, contains SUMF1/FGE domain [Saccharicrinis carchari]|uniref:Formylglycine-generating enzyme, required for sulfatase activity, contains SUMF1/FGE domain n=1 Tax=Saccharicrinis carchari TaxID=1168039 RepID=A0A521DF04_SACCC|nr:formylglycine-generating enzyme family protein [Saccharicrinis carchari]SMO70188.1 Formylglycine-generating enzyme, required for sulfatase activity, contains SUMF1/FGE domain [Saccharicrinis carchari]